MDVIAIDGPSGVGKSTAARTLADRLGYYFLSSGLLYRAMAWVLLQRGWHPAEAPELAPLQAMVLDIRGDGTLAVDGRSLPREALHSEQVADATSRLSALPPVRERCTELQRQVVLRVGRAGEFAGVVLEGRDIGTVVYPDATHKFFLTADDHTRAERRFKELREHDPELTLEAVARALQERDERDSSRDVAPLRAAADAVTVDTSQRNAEQVLALLLAHVRGEAGAAQ